MTKLFQAAVDNIEWAVNVSWRVTSRVGDPEKCSACDYSREFVLARCRIFAPVFNPHA